MDLKTLLINYASLSTSKSTSMAKETIQWSMDTRWVRCMHKCLLKRANSTCQLETLLCYYENILVSLCRLRKWS